MIELKGVTKTFGGRRLFYGFEMRVEAGETVVITGPSGCGKTTLLRMIAGLEQADEGEIKVNGRIVSGPGVRIAANERGVALSFQEPVLWPHLNLVENVRLANPAVSVGEAAEVLGRLGLEAGRAVAVRTLSGGEARRVDLARAVLSGRPVLLLDEPLAHLDGELGESVFNWLEGVTKTRTRLVVTHSQQEGRGWGGTVRGLAERGLDPL